MKQWLLPILLISVAAYILKSASINSIEDPRLAVSLLLAILAVILVIPVRILVKARQTITISIICTLASFYLFEGHLKYSKEIARTETLQNLAIERGIEFDSRSKLQVLKDLTSEGIRAYPSIPASFMNPPLLLKSNTVWPLAERTKSTIVLCNEYGEYITSKSDRFGFLNPDEVYNNNLEIALIGDSFAQGYCTKNNFANNLRSYYPKLATFGIGSTGPLFQYGIFREYVENLKPSLLVWVYFENDLTNLFWNHNNSHLTKYITSNETNNLFKVQDQIDSAIDEHVSSLLQGDIHSKDSQYKPILDFLLIRRIRAKFQFNIHGPIIVDHTDTKRIQEMIPIFRKIVLSTKNRIGKWGGKMLFVYLPSQYQFMSEIRNPGRIDYQFKDEVLSIVKNLGIDILDITPVFRKYDDPYDTLWWSSNSHYNDKGNAIVSDEIAKYIDKTMPKDVTKIP